MQNIKTDDTEIIEKMRTFKGDKHASQFEAGQQKRGARGGGEWTSTVFLVHLMLKMLAAMFTRQTY